MRLCRHADRRVGDAVCNLCKRISRTGADNQRVQPELRSQRLGVHNAVQNRFSRQRLDPFPQVRRPPEPGISRINGLAHNRLDLISRRKQSLQLPERLGVGAEGTAECIS